MCVPHSLQKPKSKQRLRKVVDWSSGKAENDSSGEAGGREEEQESEGLEKKGGQTENETREGGRQGDWVR